MVCLNKILLATKTVASPTNIPPKMRIGGPESSVLAGPINETRFQLGVGEQNGITASNRIGQGNFGQALFAKNTIISNEKYPSTVKRFTKKAVPLAAPIDTKIGLINQPSRKEYCGTKS